MMPAVTIWVADTGMVAGIRGLLAPWVENLIFCPAFGRLASVFAVNPPHSLYPPSNVGRKEKDTLRWRVAYKTGAGQLRFSSSRGNTGGPVARLTAHPVAIRKCQSCGKGVERHRTRGGRSAFRSADTLRQPEGRHPEQRGGDLTAPWKAARQPNCSSNKRNAELFWRETRIRLSANRKSVHPDPGTDRRDLRFRPGRCWFTMQESLPSGMPVDCQLWLGMIVGSGGALHCGTRQKVNGTQVS